jgi:hypothetical protein
LGQEILDDDFHIEVVTVAGTSGTTVPFWDGTTAGTTPDGTVTWLDQGPPSVATPGTWTDLHHYTRGTAIVVNGDIQVVTTAGISGVLEPTFNANPGGTTPLDGTVTWTNAGVPATSALAAAGGTSGIVIDNTVGSGTLAGASQVYFSTLGNQACGTSGTGGCAMQASQSALH